MLHKASRLSLTLDGATNHRSERNDQDSSSRSQREPADIFHHGGSSPQQFPVTTTKDTQQNNPTSERSSSSARETWPRIDYQARARRGTLTPPSAQPGLLGPVSRRRLTHSTPDCLTASICVRPPHPGIRPGLECGAIAKALHVDCGSLRKDAISTASCNVTEVRRAYSSRLNDSATGSGTGDFAAWSAFQSLR